MKTIIGVDDINIFLKSNFVVPSQISLFYRKILECWKSIKYKQTESNDNILSQYIWYNDQIKVDNTPLYSKYLNELGISQIGHLVKLDGKLKNYNELQMDYNIDQNMFMFYSGLLKSIPKKWKDQLKQQLGGVIHDDCLTYINKTKECLKNIRIKQIYGRLVAQKVDRSKACIKYSEQFNLDDNDWGNIYMLPFNLRITNQAIELNYKVIHNYVASNNLLYKIGAQVSPRCNFCHLYNQTTQHLFYDCLVVKNFWFKVMDWIKTTYDANVDINIRIVILGYEGNEGRITNVINKTIMYGKLYIYNQKYADSALMFNNFLSSYIDLIY